MRAARGIVAPFPLAHDGASLAELAESISTRPFNVPSEESGSEGNGEI
jgi:hypothetical protein